MSENNYAALMMKRAPTNSESWNNIKDPGIYPIAAGHPSAPDGAAGVLFVMPPKSGATQDFISTSKKRYTRTFNSGAWLTWSAGMFVGDFGFGSGPQHKADAFSDVAQIYRINSSSASTPGGSVYGVICLPCDGAPSAAYLAAGNNGELHVGRSTTASKGVVWNRVYTTAYKPTAADVGALPLTGGNLTGPVSSTSWLSAASMTARYHTVPTGMPEGAGAFSAQLDGKAPLYQPNWQWPVNSGGLYVPIVKGVSTRQGQGYPTAVSFGYLLNGANGFAHPCIHVRGDNNAEALWRFDPNSKQLFAPGAFVAGSAVYQDDGNINGGAWGGYLSNWVNNLINGRVDWGTYNRDVGDRATYDYVNQNFVRDIRLASRGEIITDGSLTEAPWGAVITGGNGNEGNQVGIMLFRYLQKNVNGNWYTVAYA
ncbi:TPA: pyocin knob domain-containing protein [Serratia marcescens]